jgi:branched-chain amino acid transport system permease protein
MMPLSSLLQFLFSGVTSGAVYAFVALAFSVTYTGSGIVNFAQGQFVMIGGMVAASLYAAFDVPVPLAMLLGIAAAGLSGLIMGAAFILPMLAHGEFVLILITLGLSIVIEALAIVGWGTDPYSLPSLIDVGALRIFGASLTVDAIIIVVMIFATLGLFELFARYTRWGRAMRATSIDPTVAASLGINVSLTIVLAFVFSATFGGLAGVLLTPLISTGAQVGLLMTLKGFTAAVLGGISSPVGSVLGGFLLGLIEAIATGYISSTYANAIGLAVLIVLLTVRPEGLLTRKTRQA